jgi:hypothetical protein
MEQKDVEQKKWSTIDTCITNCNKRSLFSSKPVLNSKNTMSDIDCNLAHGLAKAQLIIHLNNTSKFSSIMHR